MACAPHLRVANAYQHSIAQAAWHKLRVVAKSKATKQHRQRKRTRDMLSVVESAGASSISSVSGINGKTWQSIVAVWRKIGRGNRNNGMAASIAATWRAYMAAAYRAAKAAA